MNKFDTMSKDALSKMEELINASKLNELLHKKEEEDKKKKRRKRNSKKRWIVGST